MSKGSNYRPYNIPVFDKNFDEIFRKNCPKIKTCKNRFCLEDVLHTVERCTCSTCLTKFCRHEGAVFNIDGTCLLEK